jgi:hypothetical protein
LTKEGIFKSVENTSYCKKVQSIGVVIMDLKKPQKTAGKKETIIGLIFIGIILLVISRKLFSYVYGIGTVLYMLSLLDKKSIFQTYKKGKKVVVFIGYTALAVVFFGIGNINSDTRSSVASNTESDKTVAAVTNKQGETKEEQPKYDFSNSDLTQDNVNKAISNIINSKKLKSIEINEEKGKQIIDIVYNPGDVWDENALVKNNAVIATDVMEVLFKNSKVDKIWVWTQTDMTDPKGNTKPENVVNVSLTKENAKDINWPKFKSMVRGDYKALHKIADSVYIYPGIASKLK